MNGPNPRHPARATLWHLLVLVGILAVFLPTLGPLLDHHFAERQFNHDHLYLGATDAPHDHLAGVPHSHETGTDSRNNGIVYLTSDDVNYHSAGPLTGPSLHSNIVFPEPPDRLSWRHNSRSDDALAETAVPPPAPPPRA